MIMEYAVVWFGAFVLGFVVGVWVTYKTYLKPGIAKGILEVGSETYRVSKFVPRNTRI
jgi:hypothetical protein